MFKERRQWSDRKKWVQFPLFRSYVFVRIHLKENIFVLQTIGVKKIVKFQNKISIIPDQVINDIKNIVTIYKITDEYIDYELLDTKKKITDINVYLSDIENGLKELKKNEF